MRVHDTGMHVATWVASMIGLIAAAIGTWIMLAPDDGTLNIDVIGIEGSWAASDLTETWGPWLLIIGGVVAMIGMAFAAVKDRQHGASVWLIAAEALLAIVGLAAIVFGVVALV